MTRPAEAALHGTRLLLHAGDEAGARRELAARAGATAGVALVASRSGPLTAVGEALPAFGDETLVKAVYQELAAWRPARLRMPSSIIGLDTLRGALALRLGLVDEAEAHYRTGLEWAERERCPIEQGRCLQGLAEVAERRGQHREAMPLLDRAGAIFQQHGIMLYLKQVLAKKEFLGA